MNPKLSLLLILLGLEEVGAWTIELEVQDSAGNTSTDTAQVEVTP